jgi:hypothetical protein
MWWQAWQQPDQIRERDMPARAAFFGDDAPALPALLLCEETSTGWRGVTQEGEILNVRGQAGERVAPPREVYVAHGDALIGRQTIPRVNGLGQVEQYLLHFNGATRSMRTNEPLDALMQIDFAIALANTVRARYNRALILLTLGEWREGLAELEQCELSPAFRRPHYCEAVASGLRPWRGEPIAEKRLLLIHDHGFGDSIQMLRFVPELQAMGANVRLLLPPELLRVGLQFNVPLTSNPAVAFNADYFTSLLFLPGVLGKTPQDIEPMAYLMTERVFGDKWREQLPITDRPKIGLAWSVGVVHESDYPRDLSLELLVTMFPDAELHSVQRQGRDEAERLGVTHHQLNDFADCAGLMACMDHIVTIDTAAAHLAGAIGHRKVSLLLSHWHSWRWRARWYDMRYCVQTSPGDWASALVQCG